jgi:hypothetical protein
MNQLVSQTRMTMSTRRLHDFYIPMARSKISKQCLKYKVGSNWNSLPLEIKNYDKSIHAFTKKLKAHFLSQYDVSCIRLDCYVCLNNLT